MLDKPTAQLRYNFTIAREQFTRAARGVCFITHEELTQDY